MCFSSIALRKSKDALVSRESVAFDGVWSTFWDGCNLMLDRGYTLEEDRAYCTPNQWGSVKVLAVVTDMDRGRKLRKLLNANRPDRGRPPEPFTSYVLASIQGHSIDRRELANQYNGPKLTQSEIEWVDNWAAIG